jgi:hypothetical protein
MGKEAVALCRWKGETAEVKVLLEANEIILRGAIRARLLRSQFTCMSLQDGMLAVTVGPDTLSLELGQKEAERWLLALQKPAPTLAQKLGVTASQKALVIGQVDDPALKAALAGAVTEEPNQATLVVAILTTEADLEAAVKVAQNAPHCPIWCVYGKSQFATLKDSTIRSIMRESRFIDTKTSGISEKLTATRYRLRLGQN